MCERKTRSDVLCKRPSEFWVQSLITAHNSLVCGTHLAGTVKRIRDLAIMNGDERYRLNRPERVRSGAVVTVKPIVNTL